MALTISLSGINLWAVLVASIVHTVIGLIWFMPKLFGNSWVQLTGKEMKPASYWIPVGLIGHQVMAFVLAVIVNLANATNVVGGMIGIFSKMGGGRVSQPHDQPRLSSRARIVTRMSMGGIWFVAETRSRI